MAEIERSVGRGENFKGGCGEWVEGEKGGRGEIEERRNQSCWMVCFPFFWWILFCILTLFLSQRRELKKTGKSLGEETFPLPPPVPIDTISFVSFTQGTIAPPKGNYPLSLSPFLPLLPPLPCIDPLPQQFIILMPTLLLLLLPLIFFLVFLMRILTFLSSLSIMCFLWC